jgi:hypothetical protein
MAGGARRWRTPEELAALLRLDRAGWVVLTIALCTSGVIFALMLRVVSR